MNADTCSVFGSRAARSSFGGCDRNRSEDPTSFRSQILARNVKEKSCRRIGRARHECRYVLRLWQPRRQIFIRRLRQEQIGRPHVLPISNPCAERKRKILSSDWACTA